MAEPPQQSPLGNARLGTRRENHVLVSEIDEAPWLLPRREEKSFKFEKPAAIRAAISAIEKYGMLVEPAIIPPTLAAACRADGEAAFASELSQSRTCDSQLHEPLYRYAAHLDMTRAARAVVLAIRASQPLASAIAAKLGDDAALCELSCQLSDAGAKAQPASSGTPALIEDARTAHHAALAKLGTSVLTVMVALGPTGYSSGARLVWPGTHTAAFHQNIRARGGEALRDAMGVHLDMCSGDAILFDSRLWYSGGAHAVAQPRSAVLLASFCSPKVFPEGSQYTMRSRLIGRFSLLNIEAVLGRGGYGARGYSATGGAAENGEEVEDDVAAGQGGGGGGAAYDEVGYVPKPIVSLLLNLLEAGLPEDEPRGEKCRALLKAAIDGAAASDVPVDVSDAANNAEMATARMIQLPMALLRTVRVLVGGPLQREPKWAGLLRHLDGMLKKVAEKSVARGYTALGHRILSREELRDRWNEAHTGYTLSYASELRPPVDALAFSALLKAAARGDKAAITAWLDAGGSVNTMGGAGNSTLLQRASGGGQLALVAELIERGAKVNMQDDAGSTGLHAAAHIGHVPLVKLLLRSQAAVDLCDADGETPLDWATEQGHSEIIELLKGQQFEPQILHRLLDDGAVGRILALRETVTPVHDDGAGHEVIFLHAAMAAGTLSSDFEDVVESLVAAMKHGDPRDHALVASDLRVRCVELHSYIPGGGLMDSDHRDSGSSLTMSVALTDPATLSGGEFLTYKDDHEAVTHRLERGSAILFRSEDLHNVAVVKGGLRQTLVIELWTGKANRVDRNR